MVSASIQRGVAMEYARTSDRTSTRARFASTTGTARMAVGPQSTDEQAHALGVDLPRTHTALP